MNLSKLGRVRRVSPEKLVSASFVRKSAESAELLLPPTSRIKIFKNRSRNSEVLLYQLHQDNEIPPSLLDFLNDENHLQFLGYGISRDLITAIKGLGFNLSICNGDAAMRKDLTQRFEALEKLITSVERQQQNHEPGVLIQEDTTVIATINLLRASLFVK